MYNEDHGRVTKLRTENGWYVCTQLNDLQGVCESLYKRSEIRYNRDFYTKGLRLPFLIKDTATEDRSFRILQVVRFEDAHQVVCFDPSTRPCGLKRFFGRRSSSKLPGWIWSHPPYPYIGEDGYRRVCLDPAFHYANEQDKPLLAEWFDLVYSRYRMVFPEGYENLKSPHLITVSRIPDHDYAVATPITTVNLLPLVRQWPYYLGMCNLSYAEQRDCSLRAALFIDNLILGRWPLHSPIDGHGHTM
jgi:hypothetical protein